MPQLLVTTNNEATNLKSNTTVWDFSLGWVILLKNTNPNVILLTIDSLRYDHMSLYGYSKHTTPMLKYLCKTYNCIYTVARANAPYTKASFKSIMTGLLPFTKTSYYSVKGLPKIATTLRDIGYISFGIPNNYLLLIESSGYDEGFSYFIRNVPGNINNGNNRARHNIITAVLRREEASYLLPRRIKAIAKLILSKKKQFSPYILAHTLTKVATKFIEKNIDKKFFMWLHFMDVHHPYSFLDYLYEEIHGERPSNYKYYLVHELLYDKIKFDIKITSEQLEYMKMFYDAAIRTVDDAIFKFVEKLERYNILQKTLMIITSDHGEEFLEHGGIGHSGRKYITHMYDELLRVPLIIIDFSDKLIDKNLARFMKHFEWSHIDIYPTLCSLLSIECRDVDGVNVVSIKDNYNNEQRTIVSEASLFNYKRGYKMINPNEKIVIAVKKGNLKYINYNMIREELYNLSNDPNERINLVKSNSKDVDIFRDIVLCRIKYIRRVLLRERIKVFRKSLAYDGR